MNLCTNDFYIDCQYIVRVCVKIKGSDSTEILYCLSTSSCFQRLSISISPARIPERWMTRL